MHLTQRYANQPTPIYVDVVMDRIRLNIQSLVLFPINDHWNVLQRTQKPPTKAANRRIFYLYIMSKSWLGEYAYANGAGQDSYCLLICN